jgi:hypothetical protein
MWDSGGETTYGQCEVIDIEMPLIKVKGMSGDKADRLTILNTSSQAFISAEPND